MSFIWWLRWCRCGAGASGKRHAVMAPADVACCVACLSLLVSPWAASVGLERAGGVVQAITLLEGLIASQCPLSKLEAVRARLRLADLYRAYTTQADRARRRTQEAGTLLDQELSWSARAAVLRLLIHLRLISWDVHSPSTEALARAERELSAAERVLTLPCVSGLEARAAAQIRAWVAVASIHLRILQHPADIAAAGRQVQAALEACEAAGGREHILGLLLSR